MKDKNKERSYLLQNIAPDLHSAFKSACAQRDLSMRSVLLLLMEKFTKGSGTARPRKQS